MSVDVIPKLTNSRIESFKTCRRRHWFAYELGLRKELDAKALRMGTAFHAGVEALANRADISDAISEAIRSYPMLPAATEEQDHENTIELSTVRCLISAYAWRWSESPLEYLATEQAFSIPLLNPETGRPTPNFELAGKIDGIARMEDGRLAVVEHKLLGEPIEPEADLWRRLRIDSQISIYVYAARRLGYEVDCVLYDVAKKPTIKPTAVPVLDADGLKVVVDADGQRVMTKQGKPRQTASTEDGYTVLSRDMTQEEWEAKLMTDIGERPEYYFARVEIPRLNNEIQEVVAELWDIQRTIREAQLKGRWYRTCNRNTCPFCSYYELCSTGYDPASGTPEGFDRVDDVNPELT